MKGHKGKDEVAQQSAGRARAWRSGNVEQVELQNYASQSLLGFTGVLPLSDDEVLNKGVAPS